MKTLLFVYGTLKNGHARHAVLANNDARYLGTAKSVKKYAMYKVASWPGLINSDHKDWTEESSNQIWGELYEIDGELVAELDHIENTASGMFFRSEIELAPDLYLACLPTHNITFASLKNLKATCYFYNNPVNSAKNVGSFWQSN